VRVHIANLVEIFALASSYYVISCL